MRKLVQVRVIFKHADIIDGEIGDISEFAVDVTAAAWKRGDFDWRAVFKEAVGEPEGAREEDG